MKQPIMMVILSVAACASAEFGWAQDARGRAEDAQGVLDALRMPYSQKIRTFWQTLQRCVEEDPEFEIAAKVREVGRVGTKFHGFTYIYSVKLPDFMAAGVPGRRGSDEEPLVDMLLAQALQRKEVSYYAALLAVHAGYTHVGGLSTKQRRALPPPLLEKDRAKWEENHARHMLRWIRGRLRWEHAERRYLHWLFLGTLSEPHRRELKINPRASFPSRDSMSTYRRIQASMVRGSRIGRHEKQRLAVGDAIVDHAWYANAKPLAKLPADGETLRIWNAFLLNSDEKDLPAVVNGFLHYAAAHEHAPLYADMALALFVVRGYEYDAAKGRYELTEVGQRLLEYAIEHPIPKLLRVAEVLRDRWDKDALMKLIQEHHPDAATWDGFRRKVAGTR